MGTLDEVDFPRVAASKTSGASTNTSVPKKSGIKRKNDDDALFGDGTKKVKSIVKTSKKKTNGEAEKTAVWTKPVTMDLLVDGVMGMGIVREIYEDEILLETSDSCRVHLPVTQVGKVFTEFLKAGKISADDVFTVGQMIPFRVIKRMVDNGPKGKVYPTVSCDPVKLNAHLVPTRMVPGLVIHSIAESSEEKGYVLDIGLQSVKGFLPSDKVPSTGLRIGQPLVVRVESSTSRVVKVTSFVEQDNLCYEACEKLQLNHLMPGTIIECEPGQEEGVAAGVYVVLGNGVRGFIARRHLPPRLRADTSRLTRAIRCIVMFCQQNANLLVLSAHPDMIAVSKPEKRISFDGYEIGDCLTCTVMDVLPSKFIVSFSLPNTADGKASLVTATSSKHYLNKVDECETFYKIGSTHQCRVIDVRYAERSLVVATKKDILKQKMVSYKDAVPGELVKARVVNINPKGVNVMIFETVKGFMPLHLISDKAIKLEKAYEVGKEFNCRIFNVDLDRKQVIVTAKQSLLDYSGLRVTEYDASLEGKRTMGVICNIFSTGAVLVLFYNGVKGVLPAHEGKRLGSTLKRDMSIEVRIMSVDAENSRMQLSLADETVSTGGVSKPEHSTIKSDCNVFEGVIIEVIEKNVAGKRLEKAEIDLSVDSNTYSVSLSSVTASDMIEPPFESFRGSFKTGKKLPHLSLLGDVSGTSRVTSKWFVCDWLKNNKNVPKGFTDLKDHLEVCGIVTQRTGENLFVEIVGGSGLVGRVAVNNDSKLIIADMQVGQTVVGHVRSINTEKQTFNIDLKLNGNFSVESTRFPMLLSESFAHEVTSLAENFEVPVPGSTVSATVSHIVDDIVFVIFNSKITGSLRKQNYKDGVKVGEKMNCLVLSYTFPSLDAELVQLEAPVKGKKNVLHPRVVLAKKDYFVVLGKGKLFLITNRLHPNISVQDSGRISLGDVVDLADEQHAIGSLNISLLKEDKDRVEKMNGILSVEDVDMASDDDDSKSFPSKTNSISKSIRNFKIYTAAVIGSWDSKEAGSHYCVKIKLPGGTLGRLHVSEFPQNYSRLSENAFAIFLKKNIDKNVNVKVIGFSSLDDTGRIAELTMNEGKLSETRLKASSLGYQMKFTKGSKLQCFICPEKDTSSANVRVEISPIATGIVAREQLSKDSLIDNELMEGALVDIDLPECARKTATINAVSRQKGKFVLKLSLEEDDPYSGTETFKLGELVTGRVIDINKANIAVRVQLSTGQQAILGPTAISAKYERVHQHLSKFNKGELFRLFALRRDEKPRRYYVITEGRYSQYKKNPDNAEPTALLADMDSVKKCLGKTVHGFICHKSDRNVLVEIAPGISGCIKKRNKELLDAPMNTVVAVVIDSIDAQDRVSLVFEKIIYTPAVQVKEVAVKATKKDAEVVPDVAIKPKKEAAVTEEKIILEDPGFDWNGAGFTPEDMAAVGKLGSSHPIDSDTNVTAEKFTKKQGKTESVIDKERLLTAKESALASGELIETDEDFDRLLRKDPNSAEAWIRYMSFFIEKSDLSKARATAERALTVINYREEAELFNIWTAYLNLEVAYGDSASTKAVFDRACGNADSLKIHKQMASIFVANKKFSEADEIFNAMIRKFRASSDDVWYLYAEHFMSTDRQQQGRDLLQRALSSVPKARHSALISRFAQLEYQLGDAERGRTLFESLVTAYQKKTDIWMVYADFALKYGGIEVARQVLERACALPLNMHKLRPLFKKWMEFEDKHGDDQSRQLVRSQAQRYLQTQDIEQE